MESCKKSFKLYIALIGTAAWPSLVRGVVLDPHPRIVTPAEIAITSAGEIIYPTTLLISLLAFCVYMPIDNRSKRPSPGYKYLVWIGACFLLAPVYLDFVRRCAYGLYPFGLASLVLILSVVPAYLFVKLFAHRLGIGLGYAFALVFAIYSSVAIGVFGI